MRILDQTQSQQLAQQLDALSRTQAQVEPHANGAKGDSNGDEEMVASEVSEKCTGKGRAGSGRKRQTSSSPGR